MNNQRTIIPGAGVQPDVAKQRATADWLNDLITTNRGIVKVYKTAAERLENESSTNLLRDYVEQHESFIVELSNLVVKRGHEPATSTSGSNLVKQAWFTLKASITDGDGPILAEAAKDARNVLDAYEEKTGAGLSDDEQKVIEEQMNELRQNHEELSALSSTANS